MNPPSTRTRVCAHAGHTHTNLHTCAHARDSHQPWMLLVAPGTDIHVHTQPRAWHACGCTLTSGHTHTQRCARVHTPGTPWMCTCAHTPVYLYGHPRALVPLRTCTHNPPWTCVDTPQNMSRHTHRALGLARVCVCLLIPGHTRTQTHVCAHARDGHPSEHAGREASEGCAWIETCASIRPRVHGRIHVHDGSTCAQADAFVRMCMDRRLHTCA